MQSAADAFLTGQQGAWLRAAYLLTGDRSSAQDLAQETAVRVLLAWSKVERSAEPAAYARKVLLNVFLAGRRRRWSAEVATGALPEHPAADPYAAADDREVLQRALQALPARQRAAVVLRRLEDLSEQETARVLDCSVGTVKSLTSRGTAALRAQLEGQETAR